MSKSSARRGTLCCVLAALSFGGVWARLPDRAAALTAEDRAFSTAEQQLLAAGKLVVRPTELQRGDAKLIGGLAWQVIRANPSRVWRTINDVRTYAGFLPALEEARFIERVGSEQRLFFRHRMGFVSASYFVLTAGDQETGRLRFRLDHSRPGSIRDAFGELSVTPYPRGRSVVSLAILADVGEGVVAGLVRSNVHEWMLRTPEQLKQYIEKQRPLP